MIDRFQSHATYNEKCRWWARNENDDYPPEELVMKRIASGSFWAKEVSPASLRNNILGGVFLFDNTHITIKSPDNLANIKSEDLVLFRGEYWLVVSVQRSKARNQNTYFGKDKDCSHYWYLELRK